jgi:hypothetical protein
MFCAIDLTAKIGKIPVAILCDNQPKSQGIKTLGSQWVGLLGKS